MNIARVADLMHGLLAEIDPEYGRREDTKETPMRAALAWAEWCEGYDIADPKSLLKTFEEAAQNYDELVIVNDIPFISHCAHHLASIEGTAQVGYLPSDRVVGLSKIPRVVNAYARRLQTQETLTTQIADCLFDGLNARAVGVIIKAKHGCLSTRGARIHGASMTTSAMRGLLKDDAPLRAEFLSLCGMK